MFFLLWYMMMNKFFLLWYMAVKVDISSSSKEASCYLIFLISGSERLRDAGITETKMKFGPLQVIIDLFLHGFQT